jgi:uncharacterized protein
MNSALPLIFVLFISTVQGAIVPDQVLLKEYRPKSIFKIPETTIEKARFAVIDVHAHVYYPNDAGVEGWVKTMDEVGLEKAFVLSGNTGAKLDAVLARFGKFPKRFDVSGMNQPGIPVVIPWNGK